MSSRLWLFMAFLLLCSFVSAGSQVYNSTELFDQLGQLPQCALTCGTKLPKSQCEITDLDCLCRDGYPLNDTSAVQECVHVNCNAREQLQTQKIIQNICGRTVRDDGAALLGVTTTFAAIALLLCLIRLGVRAKSWALLGLDDIFIFIAAAASVVLLAATYLQVSAGLGRDTWGVAYNDLYTIFFWVWIAQLFYVSCTFLTKLSVLCFYTRVFTGTGVARGTYILLAVTGAAFVAIFFATVFQCTPVSLMWTAWDMQHTGHCATPRTMIYVNAIPNIALDCLILVLPIPTLLRLTLGWGRKLSLILVFSLGVFTIIVGALRLGSLLRATFNPFDLTYQLRLPAYWSLIEVYVGITCVCLPAIRPFLRAVKEACFGKSKMYEQYYDDTDKSSHPQQTSSSSKTAVSTTEESNSPRHYQGNVEMTNWPQEKRTRG